jgi:hypothetical protein
MIPISRFGMKLISKQHPLKSEKGEGYPMNATVVNRYLQERKGEVKSYYEAFFSRKAAPAISLALCGMIVGAYIFGYFGLF